MIHKNLSRVLRICRIGIFYIKSGKVYKGYTGICRGYTEVDRGYTGAYRGYTGVDMGDTGVYRGCTV